MEKHSLKCRRARFFICAVLLGSSALLTNDSHGAPLSDAPLVGHAGNYLEGYCVSREITKGTKSSSVALSIYTITGLWGRGRWTPTDKESVANSESAAAYGSAILSVKGQTIETSSTVRTQFNIKAPTATYNTAKGMLEISVRRLSDLLNRPVLITLRQDGSPVAQLDCSFAPNSAKGKGKAPGTPSSQKAPSSQGNSSASSTSVAKKFCNTNKPTGLASCPQGQQLITPKGPSTQPVTDQSVKPGSICSTESVADANAKAVAEANARAAASLNCTYVSCGCYFTPRPGICPPNTKGPINTPPSCQATDCFYDPVSQQRADDKCGAFAAQISACKDWKPLCIPAEQTSSSSQSKSGQSSSS